MAAISAAESQKSRKTLEVGLASSADALKLIIYITEEWKYRQRAVTVLATDIVIKKIRIDIAGCSICHVAGYMITLKNQTPLSRGGPKE